MKNIRCNLIFCVFGFFLFIPPVYPQSKLQPGFNAEEYADMLGLTPKTPELFHSDRYSVPYPSEYKHVYRSPAGPLDNLWDLYIRDDKIGIIEIRGTTARTKSWLENFYAGMVAASGRIQISENEIFIYKLADDSRAGVHAGWLTGLASIAPGIIDKINEYHARGIYEYILMGHSQGGAIAYLLNSYLHYDTLGLIPDNLLIKTYNSAAPKPGNHYYACDYDYINAGGWALHVVNTVDWVPQTPISVQTLDDFTEVNPFVDTETFTSSMGWLQKVVVRSIFRKMERSLEKAQRKLLKYLGLKLFDFIEPYMDGMVEPVYLESMNYTPAGTPVILQPNDRYFKEYLPTAKDNVFKNHLGRAYYFLLRENYPLSRQ